MRFIKIFVQVLCTWTLAPGILTGFQDDVDSSCMATILSIPMIQIEAFLSILGSSFPPGSIGGIIMAKLFHPGLLTNWADTLHIVLIPGKKPLYVVVKPN